MPRRHRNVGFRHGSRVASLMVGPRPRASRPATCAELRYAVFDGARIGRLSSTSIDRKEEATV